MQQDLCLQGLGWDELIPETSKQKWEAWLRELPKLEQFQIPRCFKPQEFSDVKRCELHHFSDASNQGYGAASYLRQINAVGKVHCSLIMAKSRLAPLKAMSIPRMELSAAALATRLDRMIKQEVTLSIDQSTFWTDSTCVLRYVENKDKRFQTFVANRISAILDQSTATQQRHVDTVQNPADEASRGITVEALLNNERWIKGPDFLKQPEEEWPQRRTDMGKISPDDPEVKKTAEAFASETSEQTEDYISKTFERFSSGTRLKRVVAWILRYKGMLRKQSQLRKENKKINFQSSKGKIVPLTVCEIRDTKEVIIKHLQNQSFKEDMQTLRRVTQVTQEKKITVKKCSNIYKLDPFMENGFMRVGGRKKHHVVNLIIDYYHRASGHSGVEYTLSLLRQGYWIIGARSIVRNIINKCFNCRRRQTPVMQQKMASLPEDRITPSKPPFTYVRVDCFGPFLVRRGRATAKS